jgi:gliding motility-associated-like protein
MKFHFFRLGLALVFWIGLSTATALAQGLCKGSLGANIFSKGDFGSGSANTLSNDPGIAPGYRYSASTPPNDGLYIITNNTTSWGSFAATAWVKTKDNSPDPNGYFMVVNASVQPGLFYQDTVSVCGNTTYQFSADIINLMLPNFPTPSIRPNLSFLVDGKEQYASGDVAQDGRWRTYGFSFTTPANATQIVLSLRNNAPGGQGNDLGLDNISFFPCGPKITMPDTSLICVSDLFKLNPSIEINDPKALAYQWQKSEDRGTTWVSIPGASTLVFDVIRPQPGQSFRLLAAASATQLNNPFCNYFSFATVLQQKKAPRPVEVVICPGGSVTLGGKVYRDSGDYDIVFKTPQGCDSIVTHRVIIEDLSQFRIQGDSIICPENFSLLQAGDFAQYRWSTGATNSSISIETPGQFSVSVTSKYGCPASHSLTVRARELQGLMEGTDPNCNKGKDGSIRITQVSGVNRPLSYTLNGKDFQASGEFKGLSAGTYLATVQASPACKLSRTLVLRDPPAFELAAIGPYNLKQFDSLRLSASANFPIGAYRWGPAAGLTCTDCAEPLAQPIRSTRYTLVAQSDRACVDSIQIMFEVIPRHNTYAPNVFSPNNDDKNDYFSLFCDRGVGRIAQLRIFDRWGNEAFTAINVAPNSPESRWDGLVRGTPAGQGLYVWRAELEFLDGEKASRSGAVLLVH